MIPKRVVLENFLSFGTPRTEIAFTDDEPLWVLGGANGVGKSAVFDAMTFALFGQHRGGGQNADLLVRHGANGFSVTFEFEFGGIDYRITRNRTGSKATQSVEQKHTEAEDWNRVPNVNSVADLKGWSERTLGLDFTSFTASVLLRQGKADEIITATGTRRLEILKQIIAAERYEALSERVHAGAKKRKDKLEELKTQRDGLTPVSEADLAAARTAVATAEAAKESAHNTVTAAYERVGHAKRWFELSTKKGNLDARINDADSRAMAADRIRFDQSRLDDLAAAVPLLKKYLAARGRIEEAEQSLQGERQAVADLKDEVRQISESLAQAKTSAERHRLACEEHEREARRLRAEAERDEKCLNTADQIAIHRKRLDEFPKTLDDQLAAARALVHELTARATTAGNAKAEVAGLLKQARKLHKDFTTVGVGVICSQCRQVVTEQHAEIERAQLTRAVAGLEMRLRDAEHEKAEADRSKGAAENDRDRLAEQFQLRAETAKRLADQQKTLADFGIAADPQDLRDWLSQKKSDADQHSATAKEEATKHAAAEKTAKQFETAQKAKAIEFEKADNRFNENDRKLAADQSIRNTLRDQLSPEWQSRVETMDVREIDLLDTERARLAGSNVVEQFQKLQQDAARRDEWVKQRDEMIEQIQVIPEHARVAVASAEADERAARKAAIDADSTWTATRDSANALAHKAEAYRILVSDIAATERQYDLHRKLDEHLGKDGLQRELVRGAEEEIVRLANDTVQNLSAGDLSLELDRDEDSDDEAFALRVRQPDKPAPTGVDYLSGSQKFRVAVAVALAIGRFAVGQARPLECVIIDEGFGSLDKDGLRAARDELNRLSKCLRRIILVSHQEEFANEFPVVIQLSHGPDGTSATAIRR